MENKNIFFFGGKGGNIFFQFMFDLSAKKKHFNCSNRNRNFSPVDMNVCYCVDDCGNVLLPTETTRRVDHK